MTKEQFKKYDKNTAYCECCNRVIDIKNISYRNLRLNGTAKRCNLCDWIFRHKGLPFINGFTEWQIKYALEFILFEKSLYINDLSTELNLTIDETIMLVNGIKVGGKKYMLKVNCEYCGEEIEKPVSVYLKNKYLYCSLDCYWNHKAEITPHGTNNNFYKRITTTCTNCSKHIEIIPYDYNKTNKFGDNHNFCSKQCYWEYRSKYYVGEKSSIADIEYTPERREKMKEIAFENSRSSKRFDSCIQLVTNNILDKNNIAYKREFIVGYYAVDNYLPDYHLFIEVMGDYWHSSPLKYNEDKYKINAIQRKTLQHDKQKHTYIKNHFNKEILYLWEYDIEHNIDVCEKLVFEYINNNGILENYHSFNYHIQNNELKLNNDIITPYQDMKAGMYHHLLKEEIG